MRHFLRTLFIALLVSTIFLGSVFAAVYVKGYTRKDGTYVRSHYRSNPDGSPYNNWSFPGNTNPYTGVTAPGSTSTYLDDYYSNISIGSEGYHPMNGYITNGGTYIKQSYDFSNLNLFNSGDEDVPEEKYIKITDKPDYMVSESFSLIGELSEGCDEVIVVALDLFKKPFDSYKLKKFEPGDKSFQYNVDEDFGNMRMGINTYVISAICKDEVISTSFDITYSK